MHRTWTMGAALAGALVLLVSACGGDDSDGGGSTGDGGGGSRRDQYVDAMLQASGDDPGAVGDEARCFAEAIVDSVGVETLDRSTSPEEIRENPAASAAELGIDLTDEVGEAFYENLSGCMDIRATLVESFTAGLDEAAAACVDQGIDDDLLKSYVVESLLAEEAETGGEATTALEEIVAGCTGS